MRITTLLRPHWKALTLALLAVVGETFADVLQPWPIKVVIDNVVQSKKLPGWLDALVAGVFAGDKYATLNFAVAAVAIIAVIGAVSGYMQKYLTTRVSQWVGHDLRRIVYQHIQRLSLAEHHESRSGDLIMRMTSDISAIQAFINSALLGILVNLLTLVGILGVMFYINWRFTLLALSIVPVLFFVVYFYTRRIKAASRAVRKREGELLSGVAEVLTSIHVVQAFAREDYEDRRIASQSPSHPGDGGHAPPGKRGVAPVDEVIRRGGQGPRRRVGGV